MPTPKTPCRLARAAHELMVARAEADFPEETCGFVFGPADSDTITGVPMETVVPMENIQNRLHAEDPKVHPRDAKTAYCFDPIKMQQVLDENEAAGHVLRGIYHSHPDHDAYFSQTDSAAAAPFGEPSYPGAVYLVYSVKSGSVAAVKAFDWSDDEKSFVEVTLEIV